MAVTNVAHSLEHNYLTLYSYPNAFFVTEMSLKNVPLNITFNVLYNKFITVL